MIVSLAKNAPPTGIIAPVTNKFYGPVADLMTY